MQKFLKAPRLQGITAYSLLPLLLALWTLCVPVCLPLPHCIHTNSQPGGTAAYQRKADDFGQPLVDDVDKEVVHGHQNGNEQEHCDRD